MGLRRKLQHLQRAARGRQAWIDRPDGSSYYYDPSETYAELFLYGANCTRALHRGEPPPEEPEVLRAIGGLASPEDRERAWREVYGGTSVPFVSYDVEKFLGTGEIVSARSGTSPGAYDPEPREKPDERQGLPSE
jgi:hypothetical protein